MLDEARTGKLRSFAFARVTAGSDPTCGWMVDVPGDTHTLGVAVADLYFRMFHRRFEMATEEAPGCDDDNFVG